MEGLTAELVLGRMVSAVQDVRDRLLRATAALDEHRVPYAVVGECAATYWVARIDEAATRTAARVDVMIRRADFPAARSALEAIRFVLCDAEGRTTFLDRPAGRPRDAVRVVFANEPVRPDDGEPAPDILPSVVAPPYRVLALEPLVRLLLTGNRNLDHVLIRDLIGVGQIDETWPDRFPPELAERLREILADPEG